MSRSKLIIAGISGIIGLVGKNAETDNPQQSALSERMNCINQSMAARLLRIDGNKDGKVDR